jgi:hypothetical protein
MRIFPHRNQALTRTNALAANAPWRTPKLTRPQTPSLARPPGRCARPFRRRCAPSPDCRGANARNPLAGRTRGETAQHRQGGRGRGRSRLTRQTGFSASRRLHSRTPLPSVRSTAADCSPVPPATSPAPNRFQQAETARALARPTRPGDGVAAGAAGRILAAGSPQPPRR